MHAASPPLQTADRALQVLQHFTRRGETMSVTEIARALSLHRSTASRLVSTLTARGFLERTLDGRVRLGPETARLGRIALDTELPALAQPILEALAERTGEAATLAVPAGERVLTVAEAPSRHFVSSRDWVGIETTAHSASDGKVLLAFSAIPLGGVRLERATDRTVVDRSALERELAAVRRTGYAVSRGELEPGLHGVAAPVFSEGTCVAALCVSGPEYRLRDGFDRVLGPQCRAAAAELERRLARAHSAGGEAA